MLTDNSVAVVVPCYNEETQISRVIETMPTFVDLIVAIDDRSSDQTLEILLNLQRDSTPKTTKSVPRVRSDEYSSNPYDMASNALIDMRKEEEKAFTPAKIHEHKDSRLVIVEHAVNGGVGAAIASGYRYARDCGVDCSAVMAGDGQMDPAELEAICMPVADGKVDYCKGNRLRHRSAKKVIPNLRYYGNSILSIMTKMASGYWRVSDTQTGYTAISLEALENIELHKIYPRYGMPNDLLVKLNIASFTVTEVPIKPVYNVGERSKMKVPKVIFSISMLLMKLFFERLFKKYLIRDFHPLFLLYIGFFVSGPLTLIAGFYWFSEYFSGNVMYGWLVAFVSMGLFSFQSLIFAMWFDIQDNERLYV